MYSPLDDVPFSVRMNLTQSPAPTHYSMVSATPSPETRAVINQQVMSPTTTGPVNHPENAGLMSATLQQQRLHLQIPSEVLREFQQSAAFDSSVLSDLRAAFQELHDRVNHRTSILGQATTALHDGYSGMVQEIQRMQGLVQTQAQEIERLLNINGNLRLELDAVQQQLLESRDEMTDVRMGRLQWQAELEAHVARLEGQLGTVVNEQGRQVKMVENLFETCTSAVGQTDPAARTAIETLASRMDTVESVVKTSLEASESVQKGLLNVRTEVDVIQNRQEQILDRLDNEATSIVASQHPSGGPSGVVTYGGFATEVGNAQNMSATPVLAMTPYAPIHIGQGNALGTPAPDWDADWSGVTWPNADWSNVPGGGWPDLGEPPGLPSQLKGAAKVDEGNAASTSAARADGGAVVTQLGREIPNARWKCLLDVPVFDPTEGSGSPWELGLRLDVWRRQFSTLASTVSVEFADYVAACFKRAQERHDLQARGDAMPPLDPVKGYPEEFESRLVIVLLKVLLRQSKHRPWKQIKTCLGLVL